jgi:hypothetical protein
MRRSNLTPWPALGLALLCALLVVGTAAADNTAGDSTAPADESADKAVDSKSQELDLQALAAISRSDEGLVREVMPNGTVILDLQGRYQVMAVPQVLPDGTRTFAIVKSVMPADSADEADAADTGTTQPVVATE